MPPDDPPEYLCGLDPEETDRFIEAVLAEDLGRGDVTSRAVIPAGTDFSGIMSARQDMVIAGMPLAAAIFAKLSPAIRWDPRVSDGEKVANASILADISGPAVELLAAERTAINTLQHLSGIATLTRRYVQAIEGTGAILLDTRKTIPGLRVLAKYATRVGGATNHRMGLDDGVLIKDNHVATAGGVGPAVARARAAGLTEIEVECDTLAQVGQALEAGTDSILLDNMAASMMRQAVEMIAGRCPTEASGDISLETIRAAAEAGVTYISVGRLTHSAPAVNIGLDWSAQA